MFQPVIIQDISFPGSVCKKCALDWSTDNKIAVCTSKAVYILVSYCSPVETGFPLPLHKQVIPAPTVALNFKFIKFRPEIVQRCHIAEMQGVMLDRTLYPDLKNSSPFLGYKSAKWSPKGAGGSGKCLLATLTMDHRLVLYQEKNKEWKSVCELSDMYYNIHKPTWEEEDQNQIEINDEILKKASSDFVANKISQLRSRAYRVAATEIIWTNMFGSSPTSINDSYFEWCYLVVAMKSGHIIWWKIAPSEGKMVSLAYEWDTELGPITSLCWQQTSPNSGFLMCGTLKGLLTFTPIDILSDEKESKVVIKDMCKLWDEADRVAVDNIVVLKTSIKKYVIVATKQCYLVACEIALTDSAIRISNVGHATGLHSLAVMGINVLDKTIPQSYIMLSTMDGLVIKMKVTAAQEAIDFHHEPLQMGIDFQKMMVQGLGLSPNGLFCAMILNTSVWYDHLVKREPLQFMMFITKPYEEIFTEFQKILKPQFSYLPSAFTSIFKYIDYFECLRLYLACETTIPKIVEDTLAVPENKYEQLTSIELYFIRFLLKCIISGLAVSVTSEGKNFESKLHTSESVIMKNYIFKVLSSCQDKIDLLTPAQGQSLLLMIDWLYIEYNMPINNIYEAFGFDCPADASSVPHRETCRICKHPVKLENLVYGQCDKNHKFGRCCQSLLLCDVVPYYQCISCKSMALQDVWNFELNCTFCSLPLS